MNAATLVKKFGPVAGFFKLHCCPKASSPIWKYDDPIFNMRGLPESPEHVIGTLSPAQRKWGEMKPSLFTASAHSFRGKTFSWAVWSVLAGTFSGSENLKRISVSCVE